MRKANKAKPPKKGARAKKPAAKPKTDRSNKKAEVIAMMKRANGATLAEIMKATGWQPHTVRGFVSILGENTHPRLAKQDRVLRSLWSYLAPRIPKTLWKRPDIIPGTLTQRAHAQNVGTRF
jgi:hypothetical protein